MKANSLDANGKYEFKIRLKFVLKNDELKRRVNDLRDATDTLTKLRHLSTSLIHHPNHSEQRTVAKYSVFLQRIQRHADVLYFAISQRLVSGCHQEHETKFFIEDRAAAWQKQQEPVNFRLILGSPAALSGCSLLSQELQVAVLDDELTECGPSVRLCEIDALTKGIDRQHHERGGSPELRSTCPGQPSIMSP